MQDDSVEYESLKVIFIDYLIVDESKYYLKVYLRNSAYNFQTQKLSWYHLFESY